MELHHHSHELSEIKNAQPLNPTKEARLHACAVDVASGKPLEGVALRVLGPARLQLFEPRDVKSLNDKLDLFTKFPVHVTGENGVVTFPESPLDLSETILGGLSFGGNKGHLIAQPPNGQPLVTTAQLSYSLIEIKSRYIVVQADVHAGYLAPLGLILTQAGKLPSQEPLRLNDLSVEVAPLVVREGGEVGLTIRWKYVKMPLMKSWVHTYFGDATLTETSKGDGRVQEIWQHKIGSLKLRGAYRPEVKAYLDQPHRTLAAAVTRAVFYVAGSEKEEKAYGQLFRAQKLSAMENKEASAICLEVVRAFPDIVAAWTELGRRLLATENWQELVNLWEKAPDRAKKSFGFVSACAVAYEKLGHQDRRWEMSLAVSLAEDTPAVARAACFQDALRGKQYKLALQILNSMKEDIGRYEFVSGERYLNWMNGDRSSTKLERIFVAQALRANQELDEALLALNDLDMKSLENDSHRETYYETLARIHLDRKDLKLVERSLDDLATLKKKPVAESVSSELLGRLAEAKGEVAQAVKHYAKGYAGSESNREAFAQVLQKSLDGNPQLDPVERICAAFSLIAAHRFSDAVPVAQKAVEQAPQSPAAHLAYGLALEMTGKIPESVEALKRATDLAPNSGLVKQEYQYAVALHGAQKRPPR